MERVLASGLLVILSVFGLFAQNPVTGNIKGVIIEKLSDKPLEFVNVVVKRKDSNTYAAQTVTDKNGTFAFHGLPAGTYKVIYSFIGFDKTESPEIELSLAQTNQNVGKLYISEASKTLASVEVVGQKSTFVNSIDRKTFNVGQDLMSKNRFCE